MNGHNRTNKVPFEKKHVEKDAPAPLKPCTAQNRGTAETSRGGQRWCVE